jgi:16S rRNA (guanine(966)-N(2))-methyltransferase RsmD
MRIISGTKKHYNLRLPSNVKLRPTTDFCREALFNIIDLYFNFEEMEVLDLFTGSGAISFEFASRGASKITCIDINYASVNFIRSECSKLNFNQINATKQDALKFLQCTSEKYNLIFADPPYDYQYYSSIHELVFERDLLKQKGWLILEHSRINDFSKQPFFIECRKYGETYLSIFHKNN